MERPNLCNFDTRTSALARSASAAGELSDIDKRSGGDNILLCCCADCCCCWVVVLELLELLLVGLLLVEEFIVVSAEGVNVKSRADNSVVDIVPVPPSTDNSVFNSVCGWLVMGVDNKEAVLGDTDLRRGESFSCCVIGGGGGGISASNIILSSLSLILQSVCWRRSLVAIEGLLLFCNCSAKVSQ